VAAIVSSRSTGVSVHDSPAAARVIVDEFRAPTTGQGRFLTSPGG
jgi:hypothetical protein